MTMLVGTSGFDYRDWRGAFYPRGLPSGDRLAYYAQRFRTVELNVTFYRMPAAAAFRGWRDAVPDDFRFAVKASRYLTHIRRLKDPREPVEFLVERATELGDRLGPILLQLPPNMPVDLDRLEATIQAFRGAVPLALEPRHESWFTAEVRAVLERHGVAFTLADRFGPITPLWTTADWTYLRLHEGRATPRPCYGRDALRSWVDRLHALPGGRHGYVFFNNDPRACAPRNAATFERMFARRTR